MIIKIKNHIWSCQTVRVTFLCRKNIKYFLQWGPKMVIFCWRTQFPGWALARCHWKSGHTLGYTCCLDELLDWNVQNSHHCSVFISEKCLGICPGRVKPPNCLWEHMWTTVDYVFGLKLHCCLPPGNMKQLCKDKRAVLLIPFSLFLCYSSPAPHHSPASKCGWWGLVEWSGIMGLSKRHQKCFQCFF